MSIQKGVLEEASNKADWIVSLAAVNEEDNSAFDWTECDKIVVSVHDDVSGSQLLAGSLDDGKITHGVAGTIQWRFTPQDMGSLDQGTYTVGLAYRSAGIVSTQIIASLPVIEGYAEIT